MSPLSIQIDGNKTVYCPGDILRGVIRWQYDDRPSRIELRLFWFTQGPGSDDLGIVDTVVQDDPSPSDARSFQFRLPAGPFSYNGQIFRVQWALELLAPGLKDCIRLNLVVSPTAQPIAPPFR